MMADGWFILPLSTDEMGETVPKYAGVEPPYKYTGSQHYFDEATHPDLPFAGQTMYVARVYADAQSDLDALAAHGDAYGKQEYGLSDQAVADYLNDKHGKDWTFTQWTQQLVLG